MVKSTAVKDPDLLQKCDEKYELIFNSQTQLTAAHKRQSGTRCVHIISGATTQDRVTTCEKVATEGTERTEKEGEWTFLKIHRVKI